MNLYKLLAISRESTPEEIKDAFRKKAVLCHPDKGGDPKEFNEVRMAYEILMDEEKRKVYDLTGEADPNFNLEKDANDLTKMIIRRIIGENKKDIYQQSIILCTVELKERKRLQTVYSEQNELVNSMKGKLKPKKTISEEAQKKVEESKFDEEVIDELLEANKDKLNVFDETYEEFKIELEVEMSRISKAVLVAEKALEILQNYEMTK